MERNAVGHDGLCECGCGEPAPLADRTHRAKGWIKGQPRRFVVGHWSRGNRWAANRDVSDEARDAVARAHLIHGDRRAIPTAEYICWCAMKARCLNPNHKSYHRYGGRGITVCQEWLDSYEAFLAHVGRRPSPSDSIDRIDPDGNYEPGNVRWADKLTQTHNRGSQS